MNINPICAINSLQSWLDFSEESISIDIIMTVIKSITSQIVTPANQALRKFTYRKLKTIDTQKVWEADMQELLNQIYDVQMFEGDMEQHIEENTYIL